MEYDNYVLGVNNEFHPANQKEVDSDLDTPNYQQLYIENKFLKDKVLSLEMRLSELRMLVNDFNDNCENGFLTILKNKLK